MITATFIKDLELQDFGLVLKDSETNKTAWIPLTENSVKRLLDRNFKYSEQ